MKDFLKIFIGFLGFIVLLLGLELGFGWFGVFKTQTVEKAQRDADREVFEQTQSYVEAKRQKAIKLYQEYTKGDEEDKETLEFVVSQEFANFDEDKYIQSEKLRNFIHYCKYKEKLGEF